MLKHQKNIINIKIVYKKQGGVFEKYIFLKKYFKLCQVLDFKLCLRQLTDNI